MINFNLRKLKENIEISSLTHRNSIFKHIFQSNIKKKEWHKY